MEKPQKKKVMREKFVVECMLCGKEISGNSEETCLYNFNAHIVSCKREKNNAVDKLINISKRINEEKKK